ncbi:MAG: hypothetical protein HZA50_14690 [Planctomycetes bacterium]|nr:hypothetical protein [Planctomycetota bacterium]
MALTGKELADVDKLLGRMEKNTRKWKFNFCIRLFFGMAFGALSAWLGFESYKFDKDAILSGMENPPSITVPSSMPASNPKSTVIHLDTFNRITIQSKIVYMRLAAHAHTLMMICSLMAGFLIGASIHLLIKEKRDLLLIKLARSYLETQRPGASPVAASDKEAGK